MNIYRWLFYNSTYEIVTLHLTCKVPQTDLFIERLWRIVVLTQPTHTGLRLNSLSL